MNTLWSYLAVTALTAFVTLPSLLGAARDRAIDRELREAAARAEPVPNDRPTPRSTAPSEPAPIPYTTAA
ncbi:hypothetical protein [Streptomyces tsukubensis]|uniref:hypothetical protein n=1 Tax=Streptomyces tsukubensis TaxID=83656 RepID=UPI00344F08B7